MLASDELDLYTEFASSLDLSRNLRLASFRHKRGFDLERVGFQVRFLAMSIRRWMFLAQPLGSRHEPWRPLR